MAEDDTKPGMAAPARKVNAPRADGRDNAPRADGRDNAPRADGRDNAPRADGRDNAPRADLRDYAPRAGWRDGPRGIGALLPAVTRSAYRKHNPASAQILADWEIIVGPKVAAMTVPRRLERGVLTIGCAGPVAMTLHYEGVALINRINTHMGGQPVHTLRFTQAGMPRTPPIQLARPPEAIREAEAAVGDFPEGELRAALASLGRVVLGRSKHSTRRQKKL